MATMRIRHPAAGGERFAPGCFEGAIGQRVPMDLQGVPLGQGTLVAAEVIEEGRAAWLTFELSDSTPAVHPSLPPGAFAFRPDPPE